MTHSGGVTLITQLFHFTEITRCQACHLDAELTTSLFNVSSKLFSYYLRYSAESITKPTLNWHIS